MRYWLLRDRTPEGPYTAEALIGLPDFDPGLMVCPEDRPVGERSNWRQARKFGEVLDAMRSRTVLASLPGPPAAGAGGRKPLVIAAAILAALAAAVAFFLLRS